MTGRQMVDLISERERTGGEKVQGTRTTRTVLSLCTERQSQDGSG